MNKEKLYLTREKKHQIIREVLSGKATKQEIFKKHTGKEIEHGHILRWMKALGYDTHSSVKPYIVSDSQEMSKKKSALINPDESFENLQLKKRIAELEAQLKEAELKAIAFSTMVDIAEKEFKIPIRKKFNTKP
jgi:transposase